jgi:hypothetical protein
VAARVAIRAGRAVIKVAPAVAAAPAAAAGLAIKAAARAAALVVAVDRAVLPPAETDADLNGAVGGTPSS